MAVEKEKLSLKDYAIVERRQSKYDPDKTIAVEIGIQCPRCKKLLHFLDHDKEQKCDRCGLKMQRFGTVLEVWE